MLLYTRTPRCRSARVGCSIVSGPDTGIAALSSVTSGYLIAWMSRLADEAGSRFVDGDDPSLLIRVGSGVGGEDDETAPLIGGEP